MQWASLVHLKALEINLKVARGSLLVATILQASATLYAFLSVPQELPVKSQECACAVAEHIKVSSDVSTGILAAIQIVLGTVFLVYSISLTRMLNLTDSLHKMSSSSPGSSTDSGPGKSAVASKIKYSGYAASTAFALQGVFGIVALETTGNETVAATFTTLYFLCELVLLIVIVALYRKSLPTFTKDAMSVCVGKKRRQPSKGKEKVYRSKGPKAAQATTVELDSLDVTVKWHEPSAS